MISTTLSIYLSIYLSIDLLFGRPNHCFIARGRKASQTTNRKTTLKIPDWSSVGVIIPSCPAMIDQTHVSTVSPGRQFVRGSKDACRRRGLLCSLAAAFIFICLRLHLDKKRSRNIQKTTKKTPEFTKNLQRYTKNY